MCQHIGHDGRDFLVHIQFSERGGHEQGEGLALCGHLQKCKQTFVGDTAKVQADLSG